MLRSKITISCLVMFLFISLTTVADEVDDLIGQLQSSDTFERCYAAEQLGKLKDDRAINPLLKMMMDPKAPVATKTPSQQTKENTPSQQSKLPSDDLPSKIEEAKRAVAAGDQYVPPAQTADMAQMKQYMVTLKSSRSIIEQKQAVKALGQLRDKRSAPILLKMLQEGRFKNGMISDVIETLGEIGDPAAYDTMVAILKQGSIFNKRSAVAALGKLGDPRAAELLYQAMVQNMSLRSEAAEALKNLGGYESVFYLNKAVASGDHFVKMEAESTLDRIGPKHGLEPLLDLLDDSDPTVKEHAVRLLTQLNDAAIQNDLQAATGASGEPIAERRTGRSRAADRFSARDMEEKMAERRSSRSRGVKKSPMLSDETKVKLAAIEALSQFRSTKMIKPLMGQLTDAENDPVVRRAAGKAMRQYQNSVLLKIFEDELNIRDSRRQAAALTSLGYLGTDEAVELILPSLEMQSLEKDGYKALSLTRNAKALPYLHEALQTPTMRSVVIDGVMEINDPSSAVLLARIIQTERMRSDDRLKILGHLATSEDPEVLACFKSQVADPFIGGQVVDLLVQNDSPEVAEPLVYAMAGAREGQARQKALDKLIEMDSPATTELVVRAILDGVEDPNHARHTMFTFGRLREMPSGETKKPLGRNPMTETLNDALTQAIEHFADQKHVGLIAKLLPIPQARPVSVEMLQKYNWQPTTTDEKIYFYIFTENWVACKEIGRPVLPYLLEELKASRSGQLATVLAQMHCVDAKPILLDKVSRWSISSEQMDALQNDFHWRPVTIEEKVNVAASTGDYSQLLKLWDQDPQVRQIITQRLNNSNDSAVSSVVRLCLRLEKYEMNSQMISRFNRMTDEHSAVTVAELFLNSGQDSLDQVARSWADRKGYRIW